MNPDKLKRLADAYRGFIAEQYRAEGQRDGRPEGVVTRRIDSAVFEFRQAVGAGNYQRVSPLKLEEVAQSVGVARRVGESLTASLDRFLERMG